MAQDEANGDISKSRSWEFLNFNFFVKSGYWWIWKIEKLVKAIFKFQNIEILEDFDESGIIKNRKIDKKIKF